MSACEYVAFGGVLFGGVDFAGVVRTGTEVVGREVAAGETGAGDTGADGPPVAVIVGRVVDATVAVGAGVAAEADAAPKAARDPVIAQVTATVAPTRRKARPVVPDCRRWLSFWLVCIMCSSDVVDVRSVRPDDRVLIVTRRP
jgi:hypothetical protein